MHDRFFTGLWRGGGALLVWALHFGTSYVLVAAGCCGGFEPALRPSLLVLSAAAIIAIAWLLARSLRRPDSLSGAAGIGTGALALVGVAWTTVPVLAPLPPCLCN
jgi:hypothetical protein